MRRWSILDGPLQYDIAKAVRIFRVCCKLHNYLIQERDPFSGMVGVDDTDGENVAMPTMTGGEPMPAESKITDCE